MNGKDTLLLHFLRIEVKGLKKLESLTKQIDPFITLTFDEGKWSNRTVTIEGAGSNAHWDIDQKDDKWKLPFQSEHEAGSLSLTLTDDNKLLTDEDIGKGSVLFSSLISSSVNGAPGIVTIDLTNSIKILLTVTSDNNPQVKHDHSKPIEEILPEKTDVDVNDDVTTPEGKSEGEPESRSPPKIEDKPISTPRLEHNDNDVNTDIPLKPEESSPKLPPRRRHVTTKIKQPRKSDASDNTEVSPVAAGHPLPIDDRPEWDNAPPGRSPPPLKRLSSVKVGIAKVNTNNYGAKSRRSLDADSPHKPLEPANAPQSADKNPKTKRVQRNISKSSENNRELHLPPLPNNSDKKAPRRPRGNLAVTKDDSMVESLEEANRQLSLPPMKESVHESARKKKPLYLRLQEEYELKIAELEKEKKEMYEKELQKKRDSRLNKDAIEAHKAHYLEYKQQKREREAREAEERKKAWKEMKDMLRAKRENPSRQNLMPPESAHVSASAVADETTFEGAEPEPDHAKEDGGGGGAHTASKERKEKKQARPRASPSKAKLVPTPPPGTDPTGKKSSGRKEEDPPSAHPSKDQPTSKSPRKARNLTPQAPKEPKEISSANESPPSSQTPIEPPKNHSNNGITLHAEGLTVTVKAEEVHSDNNDSVKMKSNWVSDMVETDPEEEKLAEVYEAGFSMLMAERGLIDTK